MRSKILHIGIVGFGHIARKHLAAIQASEKYKLTAIVDTHPEKVSVSNHQEVRYYTSVEQFLAEDGRTEAMIIATPNGLHHAQAKALLQGGRHVLIEKPAALHAADILELEKIAADSNLKAAVVQQNRFSGLSRWLDHLMQQNMLGKIYLIQSNCFWNRGASYYSSDSWHGDRSMDGGTLFTQFSHYLDLIFALFGYPEQIQGQVFNFNHQHLVDFEDSGSFLMQLESGAVAQFNFSTSVYSENLESTLSIIAEEGTIKLGGQYMETLVTCTGRAAESFARWQESHGTGLIVGHAAVLEDFYQTINQGTKPAVDLGSAYRLIHSIEKMYEATQVIRVRGSDKLNSIVPLH